MIFDRNGVAVGYPKYSESNPVPPHQMRDVLNKCQGCGQIFTTTTTALCIRCQLQAATGNSLQEKTA